MNTKFFNIQKAKKEKDTQPDYKISFKTEDTFVEAGACWKKTDKAGNTFLSCKFGDAWMDGSNGAKNRKGYHIEQDEEGESVVDAIKKAKTAPGEDL